MADIGDIYLVKIYFKGQSGDHKIRPCLVFNMNQAQHLYSIAEITTIAPKNPPGYFDSCKEEIYDLQPTGLDCTSFVKCHKNNLHNVLGNRLLTQIGETRVSDLMRILTKISDVNL